MKVARSLLALSVFLGGNLFSAAVAQAWVPANAPSTNWAALAGSADGQKLIAAANGGNVNVGGYFVLLPGLIYLSTNAGLNWFAAANAPALPWVSVGSSADGTRLVAAARNHGIYQSLDSGTTWNETSAPISNRWLAVTSSTDGTRLAALAVFSPPPNVFVSKDAGKTWTPKDSIYDRWTAFGASADGLTLTACGGLGYVMVSTNSGDSWTTNRFASGFNSIATPADGRLIFLAGSAIQISTNAGQTWWTQSTNKIQSIAASADGNRLVALGAYPLFDMYSSEDFGNTWSQAAPPLSNFWRAVACSADGCVRVAAAASGGIWVQHSPRAPDLNISIAGGELKLSWLVPSTHLMLHQSPDLLTWSSVTNAPVLNLTNLQNQVSLPLSGGNWFYRLKSP